MDVFNNVLNEVNQDGWTQLQLQGEGSGSQSLLQNVERYGGLLAMAVKGTKENNISLSRENICKCPPPPPPLLPHASFPSFFVLVSGLVRGSLLVPNGHLVLAVCKYTTVHVCRVLSTHTYSYNYYVLLPTE